MYKQFYPYSMLARHIEKELHLLKAEFPILGILGPRQSGKTTLSRKTFPDYEYISLEDIDHREFAVNDPRGFLARYTGRVILDEIQRVPDLISYLQSHVDAQNIPGSIVITGSHNFLLMEQISQSLAGRIGILKLLPFSLAELNEIPANLNETLFRGLYPRIYDQEIRPASFYRNYLSTYLEKDIRQIKNIVNLDTFSRFLRVLAGRTGQELNLSTISEECGISHNTVKEWISVLETSFLIHRIPPFHKNYNKRLVKNPKIYFTDTGLACHLLGIRKPDELDYHFLRGSLFETLVVSEFLKINFNSGEPFRLYFWRDNHKKEIDLILETGTYQRAIEIKSSRTLHERFFDGLYYWQKISGQNPSSLYLIHGGEDSLIRNNMNVIGWNKIQENFS